VKTIGQIPHRAELLTIRLITGLIGIEALCEALVLAPAFLSGESKFFPYRMITSAIVGIFIPLCGGFFAIRGSLRSLRIINGATATGHIVVLTGWILLVPESNRELNIESLWILASGPAIAAALIAWGLRWGWIVYIFAAIGFPILDYLSSENFSNAEVLLDTLKSLVFSLSTAAAVVALLSAAKQVDAQAEVSREAAELSASASAQARSRQEANLLVHDDILSTLIYASGNDPQIRFLVARQAHKALSRINEMAREDSQNRELSYPEFVALIEKVITHAEQPVSLTLQGPTSQAFPEGVVTAVTGALSQALANSLEHAASAQSRTHTVERWIRVLATDSSLEVTLEDNGRGFDPSSVPLDRLGIEESIKGRLRALPGGNALVVSAPGRGTRVTLSWIKPGLKSTLLLDKNVHSVEFAYGRRAIMLLALVYGACHLLIAGIRLSMGAAPVPSIGALILLCTAMGLLAFNGGKKPSKRLVRGIVILAVSTALMQVIQPASAEAPRLLYWYLAGIAAILVLLVLNNHALVAWATLSAVLAISVISAASQELLSTEYALVLFRLVLMLGTGTLFLLPLNYFQRRLVALREDEEKQSAVAIFENTASHDRLINAINLQKKAGSMLTLLSEGRELTPTELTRCVALEGRLRDESRGARLAQGLVPPAAALARARGVEVVLTDDGGENASLDQHLEQILTWMSDTLDALEKGKFTGRIVPSGTDLLATIVTETPDGNEQLLLFRKDQDTSVLSQS
jgi:signal transduction histidine kinase